MTFSILPLDVVRHIFSYMPFHERERAKRVSKTFKSCIRQIERKCLIDEFAQVKNLLTQKEINLIPFATTYRNLVRTLNIGIMRKHSPGTEPRSFDKNALGKYLIEALDSKHSPKNPFLLFKSKALSSFFPELLILEQSIGIYRFLEKKFKYLLHLESKLSIFLMACPLIMGIPRTLLLALIITDLGVVFFFMEKACQLEAEKCESRLFKF